MSSITIKEVVIQGQVYSLNLDNVPAGLSPTQFQELKERAENLMQVCVSHLLTQNKTITALKLDDEGLKIGADTTPYTDIKLTPQVYDKMSATFSPQARQQVETAFKIARYYSQGSPLEETAAVLHQRTLHMASPDLKPLPSAEEEEDNIHLEADPEESDDEDDLSIISEPEIVPNYQEESEISEPEIVQNHQEESEDIIERYDPNEPQFLSIHKRKVSIEIRIENLPSRSSPNEPHSSKDLSFGSEEDVVNFDDLVYKVTPNNREDDLP